jgi:2-oxoisovalerate dehydrogenase E2 component (dihydrolipoyl transacylase)
VVRQGQIAIRRILNLSSSFDHRVVDGADGAIFIQCVKDFLEFPATIFI